MSNGVVVAERTDENERAESDERTETAERAEVVESTGKRERAVAPESIDGAERADLSERTVGAERAVSQEKTVQPERHWGDRPIYLCRAIVSLIIALALWQPALAQQPALPDPTLTPGAILDTDPTIVCAPGYDKSHRIWRNKRSTAAKYGIPWIVAQGMEDDDLIPIRLGGNNADPKNHWLQPLEEAVAKDVQERHDEVLVCHVLRDQGSIAATKVLHERQQFYLTNGWAK